MSLPVFFISTLALENWDHTAPWIRGIGGSETSHIEMAKRLKKRDYNVRSYTPCDNSSKDAYEVPYRHFDSVTTTKRGVYIWYRDPGRLDAIKSKGSTWWFVAQDVDYEGQWTPERMDKVDRYICLCQDHAAFTRRKYPEFKDKIHISSNGIRTSYIRNKRGNRNPNRLFFPSSPDRGIKFLLENWFRVREINKKAEINIAYGFNNMESLVRIIGPSDWRAGYQKELEALVKQPGVTFLGRLNQAQVYHQWAETNIWAHPTDFPETSCITCMEAQALGAWPVTNDLWALKDNVQFGWRVSGIPQKSALVRSNWLHALEQAFHCRDEKGRKEMQEWALRNFDWEKVVDQWEGWLKEDA